MPVDHTNNPINKIVHPPAAPPPHSSQPHHVNIRSDRAHTGPGTTSPTPSTLTTPTSAASHPGAAPPRLESPPAERKTASARRRGSEPRQRTAPVGLRGGQKLAALAQIRKERMRIDKPAEFREKESTRN
ncbi:unnamed protein product [Gadus morhua 'NCC']